MKKSIVIPVTKIQEWASVYVWRDISKIGV